MNTALYILDRIFGCWLGRHLWSDEWEEILDHPKRVIIHRACTMASCTKHQVRGIFPNNPRFTKWEDISD